MLGFLLYSDYNTLDSLISKRVLGKHYITTGFVGICCEFNEKLIFLIPHIQVFFKIDIYGGIYNLINWFQNQ